MTEPPPPVDIASRSFSSSFRGFDPTEVRAFLTSLATELAGLRAQVARLEVQLADAEERAARPDRLDDATVIARLGEEAARVLTVARSAADDMRAKAAEAAQALRGEASAEAGRIREEAHRDARREIDEAHERAGAVIEEAKHQGREMLGEAQAVRERVLADLARRRNNGRSQLEHLRAGRDRLLAAFESARTALEEIGTTLHHAAPDAGGAEASPGDAEPVYDRREPSGEARGASHGDDVGEAASAPVDDILDRIRAARVEVLAEAPSLSDPPEPPAVHQPETTEVGGVEALTETAADEPVVRPASGEPAVAAEPSDSSPAGAQPVTPVAVDPEAGPTGEPDLFSDRRAALVAPVAQMNRRLKRMLADEQNAVLDQLRRTSKVRSLDDVLPDEVEHAARYHEAVRDELWEAALCGARLSTGRADEAVAMVLESRGVADKLVHVVTADVVDPIRERSARSIADAGGDPEQAAGLLRSAYREWKVQRIEAIVDHLAMTAFELGAFTILDPGTCVRWMVDPSAPPCADADDNALAGLVRAGEAFPTGHLHAPAYPGCRCHVATSDA